MSDRISLGAVWEEAFALFRAEATLLLPVAFAGFGLPLILLQRAMPQQVVVDEHMVGGAWLWLLIPAALFSMAATLAISALASRPGLSVREAVALAIRRLPAGAALAAMGIATLMLATVPVSVLAAVEQGVTGSAGALFAIAFLLLLVAAIFVLVRAILVWAVLADGETRPLAALRRSFALTRRSYIRLLLLRVVAWMAQSVTMLVTFLPLAVVFGVVGRLAGAPAIGELLAEIGSDAVVAAIAAMWTVYVTRLYRRLDAG